MSSTPVSSAISTQHATTKPDTKLIQLNVEEITCAICLEIFKNPVALPCLHTYCQACTEQLMNKTTHQLNCPTCRKHCTLGPVLTANFLMQKLIDMYHATKATPQAETPSAVLASPAPTPAPAQTSKVQQTAQRGVNDVINEILREIHNIASQGQYSYILSSTRCEGYFDKVIDFIRENGFYIERIGDDCLMISWSTSRLTGVAKRFTQLANEKQAQQALLSAPTLAMPLQGEGSKPKALSSVSAAGKSDAMAEEETTRYLLDSLKAVASKPYAYSLRVHESNIPNYHQKTVMTKAYSRLKEQGFIVHTDDYPYVTLSWERYIKWGSMAADMQTKTAEISVAAVGQTTEYFIKCLEGAGPKPFVYSLRIPGGYIPNYGQDTVMTNAYNRLKEQGFSVHTDEYAYVTLSWERYIRAGTMAAVMLAKTAEISGAAVKQTTQYFIKRLESAVPKPFTYSYSLRIQGSEIPNYNQKAVMAIAYKQLEEQGFSVNTDEFQYVTLSLAQQRM